MAVDIVQEVKLRTNLVELISAYVPLRQAGRTHKGLCPFHQEKTPSFTVDPERGLYKCWGCGAAGDCFSFVQQREGLSFHEAGEFLARRVGLEWTRKGETAELRSERQRLFDLNALAERFFRQCLERAPDVREYLDRRGLTPEVVEQFRIGFAPGGYDALLSWLKRQKVDLEDARKADLVIERESGLRDRFVERVIFPICDVEGRPVAFGGRTLRADGVPKYLNSGETPIFQKGKTLYGLHLAKAAIPAAGFAVVVEGYMDVIALHQAGIANTVAGMGTAFGESQIGILRRYLGGDGELVCCYDGDGAGMRAALANSAKFEAAGCRVRVASLPEGEDPDTYIKNHGADALRALLTRAEPLLDYQLTRLRAGYNLKVETNRLPFVREAARIIAQSASHLTRQEYAGKLTVLLDRLADEWYPGDPARAMQARVALSQEVNRLLRLDRLSGRENGRFGGPAGAVGPAPSQGSASAPVSAQLRAERYVIRAALSEYRWAEWVSEVVTPEHFTDEELRSIASALLGPGNGLDGGNNEEGETAGERAERVRSDPALAGLVSGLVLDEAPVSDEGLESNLVMLERLRKQRRKTELLRLHEAGELAEADPRSDELRSLMTELGGRRRYED